MNPVDAGPRRQVLLVVMATVERDERRRRPGMREQKRIERVGPCLGLERVTRREHTVEVEHTRVDRLRKTEHRARMPRSREPANEESSLVLVLGETAKQADCLGSILLEPTVVDSQLAGFEIERCSVDRGMAGIERVTPLGRQGVSIQEDG